MLPFVKYIAYKNSNLSNNSEIEDLVQTGVIGLIKAIENFDYNKSNNFVNFAALYISGEIKRYFRDYHNLLKIPRDIYENFSSISNKINQLKNQLKRSPTLEEITKYTNIDKEKLIEYMELSNSKNLSMDSSSKDNSIAIKEILTDLKSNTDVRDKKLLISEALSKLDNIEKTVITLKFFEGLTQQEIAKKLNTFQVNISRIQSRALKKLKEVILKEDNPQNKTSIN
jgi:RNA polymerase sigma-B factor